MSLRVAEKHFENLSKGDHIWIPSIWGVGAGGTIQNASKSLINGSLMLEGNISASYGD